MLLSLPLLTAPGSFAGTFLALAMAAVFLLLFLGDEVDEIVMKDAHVDVTLGGSLEQGSQFGDLRLHQSESNHRLSCLAIPLPFP